MLVAFIALLYPVSVGASSHMDAPLITLDDAANTTDLYAFLTDNGGVKYLITALAVFPFEEPGIGPKGYRFDDNVDGNEPTPAQSLAPGHTGGVIEADNDCPSGQTQFAHRSSAEASRRNLCTSCLNSPSTMST